MGTPTPARVELINAEGQVLGRAQVPQGATSVSVDNGGGPVDTTGLYWRLVDNVGRLLLLQPLQTHPGDTVTVSLGRYWTGINR